MKTSKLAIIFSTIFTIFLFSFNNKGLVNSACYESCCIDWNNCCKRTGGGLNCVETCSPTKGCVTVCREDIAVCASCCEGYGQCEVECPCDDSCSGSCALPSCPAGYSPTNPNNYCSNDRKTIGCSYSNDCGRSCGISGTCYRAETNTSPTTTLTTVRMSIDNSTFLLSSDRYNPTRIVSPISDTSPMRITVEPLIYSNISLDRGVGYILRGNNYGINNEWIAWSDCSNPRPEDYCRESTVNTMDIAPSSMSKTSAFKPGSTGDIGALYYSTNRCDNNKQYSSVKQVFYKVNTPPNSSMTKITNSSTTDRGCTTTTFTGLEANNPFKIRYESTDVDGNSEIEAFVLWISKTNTSPQFSRIATTNSNIDTNEIGIMVKKNNNSWTNSPLIYTMNTDKNWILTNNGLVDVGAGKILSIHNIVINEGANVAAQYEISFTDKVNGMFNMRGAALDKYMFMQDGRIDQRNAVKYFDWGVDLINPEARPLTKDILSSKEFNLSWYSSDSTSNISNYVINAYRTDLGNGGNSDYISMATMPNNIALSSTSQNVPSENLIGLLTDSNTWKFTNLNINPYSASKLVNINNNELGTITMYGTAYDTACNYASVSSQIRLDPWYATKGSIVYSYGYPGIEAQLINSVPSLRTINNETLDKATEILSSSNQFIPKFTKPNSTAVRAVSITDSNLRKDFWFEYLKKKFETEQEKTPSKQITSINECLDGESCYLSSTEDINIASGTQCKGKILVMSDKNINLYPNIESGSSKTSGCIFFARNSVNIKEGVYNSTANTVKYDYIDGFVVANNQINIEFADSTSLTRDGVEINGALVAFGKNLNGDSAVNMQRDLMLYNNTNPVTVLNYDYKFQKISTIFFGRDALLYKREVGSKGL